MKVFSEHQPGNDSSRGSRCPTGWSIFSKPTADTESSVCLTDGMDEWGSKRAGIVKIFLYTRAAISQLVCGSLPHNLRLLV